MRWIVRIFLAIVLLIVVAIGALFVVPLDWVAQLATDRFTAATGRSMSISGQVRPSLWPTLGLRAAGIEIGNADWSDKGSMLRADSLAMGVDLVSLLSGDIRVQKVVIVSPKILLERAADGRANWDFKLADATGAESGVPSDSTVDLSSVSLEDMRITNAQLIYDDQAAGIRYDLSGINMRASLPAATDEGKVTLSARMNGVPLAADLTVARMVDFMAGRAAPLTVAAKAGSNSLSYDGNAGFSPMTAEGAIDVALSDPAALATLADAGPVSLPEGVGKPRLKGDVTLTDTGAVALRGAVLEFGQNRLTGTADITTAGPRPRLTAALAAETLDLSAFTNGSNDATGADTAGWPRDPIDASGLRAVDAEVTLRADAIDLGTARIGRTDLGITLDNGRLVTRLREVRAFDGTLTGEMVVNGRSGLSIAGDLVLTDLALRPALATLADMNRLVGTGNGAVKFQSSGASVDALMKGLSGNGNLAFTNGEILGLDLVGMLRTLDTSYMGAGAKTIFDSITGTFSIKDGVLTNNDMVMAAPLIRAEGRGTADIGAQSLTYRVTPIALSGADGTGGLRVPLLISGPWATPRFKLDLEGAAKQNLTKERGALEQKAKDALGAQADKLGLTPQEGESTGDAAKRAIEDKARDALKGLLGR